MWDLLSFSDFIDNLSLKPLIGSVYVNLEVSYNGGTIIQIGPFFKLKVMMTRDSPS